jgi:hypothetical protein
MRDTLTLATSFGDPIVKEVGEIGSAGIHGYERNGSWSLHGGEGWIPCLIVRVRWKHKRRFSVVKQSDILEWNGKPFVGF